MSDVVNLPEIIVTATPLSPLENDFQMTLRPPLRPNEQFIVDGVIKKLIANGVNIFRFADARDSIATMSATFAGWDGLTDAETKSQLTMHAAIQKNLLKDRASLVLPATVVIGASERTSILYAKGTWAHNVKTVPSGVRPDFFGTPLMFAAGVYYWIFGGGQKREVYIQSLNLQFVPDDFPAVLKAVAANGEGTYTISEKIYYNTFGPGYLTSFAGLLLGRVVADYTGVLVISPTGAYTFNGSLTIRPDIFDADPSKRPPVQEALTTALRYLGDKFGHVDYQIDILGAQAINFSGNK